MEHGLIVFDMDGVLVDVSESYREAIAQTVQHFTGYSISHTEIQDYKNEGGFNDDWVLSHHVIRRRGVAVDFETVVNHFQHLFHGNGTDGLILRERWIAKEGFFERVNARFDFAIFTGRMRWEAGLTLQRFAGGLRFDPIIGMEDVKELKPAPEGLLRIREAAGSRPLWYVGDSVDDARSGRAARVPFIGIAAPSSPKRDELISIFQEEQAIAILDDINQLQTVLR